LSCPTQHPIKCKNDRNFLFDCAAHTSCH
jgi:hypothetical protein